MTRLDEIQDTAARNAIAAALEAARASYGEIQKARDELNEMEGRKVYAEGHIEDQRRQRAEAVRRAVEGFLDGAHRKAEAARSTVGRKLASAANANPELLAAAENTISMFLGDLREDPERLLAAYEQSFDVAEDRRAIERLAERALRVLPDTRERGFFEGKWNRLRESLEDRLPQEERHLRRSLAELGRAREYLGAVAQVATAATGGLVDPRRGGNLTAFAKAQAYEEELSGERAAVEDLPHAKSGALPAG